MKDLYAALVKAQSEMGRLIAGETAKVPTKAGGTYSYSYASLADVLAIAKPPLNANGIAIIQGAPEIHYEGQRATVTVMTTLAHESGDTITEPLALVTGDVSPQGVGSAITYARRYGLQMICGLAPDSDDDGQRAAGKQAVQRAVQPAHRPPAPPAILPVKPKPQSEPQPEDGDDEEMIDMLRRSFHAKFAHAMDGLNVDEARHWYVEQWSLRNTPDNVRTSSNELTAAELADILERWDTPPARGKKPTLQVLRSSYEQTLRMLDASNEQSSINNGA